uniref:ArfGAP with FG repeats 1b n=1 Tax=Nothobranchius furzeri TaxID=105023 RepID=A0A8C6NSH4_NOTFU
MTTFTQQEIDLLQKHGNEVCKHIWLGLYDDRTSVVPDFREPQKVKEFLQEKYEKKRWYVPPDQARAVASVQASVSGSSASSTGSTPEVHPLKTLQLSKTPPRRAHAAVQEKTLDLLSDLGGDIFAAPSTQSAGSSNFANFAHFPTPPANPNTNFANFEAFGNSTIPSHLSTSPPLSPGGGVTVPSMAGAVAARSQTGRCTEDRYAALAELDSELSSTLFGPVLGSSPAQNPSVLAGMQPGFGAVPSTNPFVAAAVVPDMATNPFQTNGRAPPAASFGTGSMSMPAGFGNASSFCLPTSFSGNFQHQLPGPVPVPYSQLGAYHPQSNGQWPIPCPSALLSITDWLGGGVTGCWSDTGLTATS